MKTQILRFSPHQNAKVVAILMAVSSLIFVLPMSLMFFLVAPQIPGAEENMEFPKFVFLLFPFMYLVFGYVSVAIGALFYNFLTRFIGGLEFELREESQQDK